MLAFVLFVKVLGNGQFAQRNIDSQAHAMVDLNVEFVNNPNDLYYYGSTSTLASIGCDGSLSTIATRDLFTTIITMRCHGQHWPKKKIFNSKKVAMPQHRFFMQQIMF